MQDSEACADDLVDAVERGVSGFASFCVAFPFCYFVSGRVMSLLGPSQSDHNRYKLGILGHFM